MADDELVVHIEGGAAADTGGAVIVDTGKEGTTDPVADLKAQYEELEADKRQRQQREQELLAQAQREAQGRVAAEQERDAARQDVADTRLGAIDQGLASAQAASDAGEAEYAAAYEAGDGKRMAKAQVAIADARHDLKRFTEAKADIEVQRAAPQRTEARREAAPADPVEAFLAQRSPAAQSWLRAHPDEARALAYNDPRRSAKINAAHSDALAEGAALDSPEYFAHVEKFIGMSKPNGAAKPTNGSQPARRPTSAPVAPVQASAGGTNGGGREVRLTQGEAKAATDGTLIWNYDDPSPQKKFKKGDPIGIQEMARRKETMEKQGVYDKTYVAQ